MTGTGVLGEGVGAFLALAFIEANFGTMGLYLSFLLWLKTGVVPLKRRGWAAMLNPAPVGGASC